MGNCASHYVLWLMCYFSHQLLIRKWKVTTMYSLFCWDLHMSVVKLMPWRAFESSDSEASFTSEYVSGITRSEKNHLDGILYLGSIVVRSPLKPSFSKNRIRPQIDGYHLPDWAVDGFRPVAVTRVLVPPSNGLFEDGLSDLSRWSWFPCSTSHRCCQALLEMSREGQKGQGNNQ